MDLKRIDNLWKFLTIKNNLKIEQRVTQSVSYQILKSNQSLIHEFNPKLLLKSSICIQDKGFQESLIHKHYHSAKKQFGIKQQSISPAATVIFFPKELLKLGIKYELEIFQDRLGLFKVKISPFNPKNIYEILNPINLISRTLWIKNFFAEGIRN